MKILSVFLVPVLCLLASCSPKVTSTMTKTYPSISSDTPVKVFYKEDIPSESEEIGKVHISDTGLSGTTLASDNAEYKFSEHWGIGAALSTNSGLLNSVTVNKNGYKKTLNLGKMKKRDLDSSDLYLAFATISNNNRRRAN